MNRSQGYMEPSYPESVFLELRSLLHRRKRKTGSSQGDQAIDVLSDTQGVDFGPYLQVVLKTVKQNWFAVVPESARPPFLKRSKVDIEFSIFKDGAIAGMTLAGKSGDDSLDRAAWVGIASSNPLPPLPTEFSGQYLTLRFHFLYNPDKAALTISPALPFHFFYNPLEAPLTISPSDDVSVPVGSSQQFLAKVKATGEKAVMWNVSGSGCDGAACGTISSTGLYTAPVKVPTPPNVTVVATLGADPMKTASAVVTIVQPRPSH